MANSQEHQEIQELEGLTTNVQSAVNYVKIELTSVLLLLAILGFRSFKHWLTEISEHPNWRRHVIDLLRALMHESRSDRAIVALFHNGERFSNHSHFKKFSLTHEVKREGLASIRNVITNVPIEAVEKEIEMCKNNPNGAIVSRSDSSLPIGCVSHLASIGAKVAVYWYIEDRGKPIGFLGLFYNSPIEKDVLGVFLDSHPAKELVNRIKLTIIKRRIC